MQRFQRLEWFFHYFFDFLNTSRLNDKVYAALTGCGLFEFTVSCKTAARGGLLKPGRYIRLILRADHLSFKHLQEFWPGRGSGRGVFLNLESKRVNGHLAIK